MLPLGKLPVDLLSRVLSRAPVNDPQVLLGPGIGRDCAVVESDGGLLVLKSDPVTFVTEDMGSYLVRINANDVATTGATPRWLMVTLLLPEDGSSPELVESIMDQVYAACRSIDVAVVGGHSEVAHGLSQPMAVGALIGCVDRDRLVTPEGARPGDHLLLTKGVPIEGTSILAREFPQCLEGVLSSRELSRARDYLNDPGISVLPDARIALECGRVTAMHDPTEGGLTTALWELAEASGRSLRVDLTQVPVPDLAARVCAAFGIDPLSTIASGALLLTAPPEDAMAIMAGLTDRGIVCARIGDVADGPADVRRPAPAGTEAVTWPARDGLAEVYERRGL